MSTQRSYAFQEDPDSLYKSKIMKRHQLSKSLAFRNGNSSSGFRKASNTPDVQPMVNLNSTRNRQMDKFKSPAKQSILKNNNSSPLRKIRSGSVDSFNGNSLFNEEFGRENQTHGRIIPVEIGESRAQERGKLNP